MKRPQRSHTENGHRAEATAQKTQRACAVSPTSSSPTRSTQEFFRSKDVVQILGISRRQLQYWAQTDLVVPSAKTPGGHHRYSFEDLVALKTTKRLIDAGVSVQRIRKSIQTLRDILPKVERPLSELTLVATGDVVLVFHQDTVFEAASGQEWVFEVARFQQEIESWRRLEVSRTPRRIGSHRRENAAERKEIGRKELGRKETGRLASSEPGTSASGSRE